MLYMNTKAKAVLHPHCTLHLLIYDIHKYWHCYIADRGGYDVHGRGYPPDDFPLQKRLGPPMQGAL
jgi:hypothetical protein